MGVGRQPEQQSENALYLALAILVGMLLAFALGYIIIAIHAQR